jgi:predicted AAA+ superfamily ATPase
MIERTFWIHQIRNAFKKRSIVWIAGVRRVGKTTLVKMYPDAIYVNCDLPSEIRRLRDPESFYDSLPQESVIIFDEVHRTSDPSQLLKIAADVYPKLKILATGSSTLSATKKFRDSLTGRKFSIYLPPVLWHECLHAFDVKDLDHRLLHGGLPEPLLAHRKDPSFFAEWIDSFYARDIQELFNIRNRTGFLQLLQLLLRQSGGLLDYTNLSNMCDLVRPTVKAHIEVMNVAQMIFLLPPFHGGGRREIIARPKVYAFDTGFVTHVKGWDTIREDDRGILWEHIVLEMLRTCVQSQDIFYWRNKSNCEIDFIIKRSNKTVDAIECKTNPDQFHSKSLLTFRSLYPKGRNFVISPQVKKPYQQKFDHVKVEYHSLSSFPDFTEKNEIGDVKIKR